MECNRDEALRAIGIAEKKMEVKDYLGAQKITLKAKQLCPDLENTAQILAVCNVHCVGENKVQGSELDWYRILQVEPTADEATIKKQYRKLALLLHPDKNKLSGAEYAFKLIGEAVGILSDQAKRGLYDMKRRHAIIGTMLSDIQNPASPDFSSSARKSPGFASGSTDHTVISPPQAGLSCQQQQNERRTANEWQPLAQSTGATFWSMCPFCSIKYQYSNIVMNKRIRCGNCMDVYIAVGINVRETRFGTETIAAQSLYPQSQDSIRSGYGPSANNAPPQAFAAEVSCTDSQVNATCASRPSENSGDQVNATCALRTSENSGEVEGSKCRDTSEAEKVDELKKKATMVQQHLSYNSRKRRRILESECSDSKSADSKESIESDMEEQFPDEQNAWASSDHPRRFLRIRRHVNYNEDRTDEGDDSVSVPCSSRSNINKTSGSDLMNEMDSTQPTGNTYVAPELSPPLNQQSSKQKLDHSRQENKLETGRVGIDDAGQDSINRVQRTQHESPDESDEDCNSPLQPEYLELPDSEFHDFDSDKTGACFSVDQVWAVYDNLHGLPRYYAVIRKVLSTDFKLLITWLEAFPGCTEEESWLDAELPVACGGYILGETEATEDRLMFSHLVKFERGRGKIKYKIYPKKGEIWALYKDWDINWFSNPEGHCHFEYDIVELLMDYSKDTGGDVVPLVKVKGFQSLYIRMTKEGRQATFHVPGRQSYRFSHQIPAYSMKGNEKEGIPVGSFELDIAAFPCNFKDSVPMGTSREVEVQLTDSQCQGASSSKPINSSVYKESVSGLQKSKASGFQEILKDELDENMKEDEDVKCNESGLQQMSNIMDKKPEQVYGNKLCEDETMRMSENYVFGSPECSSRVSMRDSVSVSASKHLSVSAVNGNGISVCRQNDIIMSGPSDHLKKLPAPEFYDFMNDRTINKFRKNQIWAVFDNLDDMPRFYAWIKRIDHSANKVHIIWLVICHEDMLSEEVMWLARKLPVSCGVFKAKDCDCVSPELFSHHVRDEPSQTEGKFGIYPRQGEVWAIYNRWSSAWTKSDHMSHKCSIVEVISTYSAEEGVRVQHLTRIKGHHYIFKKSKKPESNIPRACLFQFSHQVPAFKLQDEAGGRLKGCWELDPASLPKGLFTCFLNAT
ncbi:DnaJ-like protein subfamily B member 14 [Nymphaea thermarum]|nr:DnaJ-like protein subfamily B member 14 [Nymphaea thermarum]